MLGACAQVNHSCHLPVTQPLHGATLTMRSRRFGHSGVKTTMMYIHVLRILACLAYVARSMGHEGLRGGSYEIHIRRRNNKAQEAQTADSQAVIVAVSAV